MKLTEEEFDLKLKNESNKIGINLDAIKLNNLFLFKELVIKWNENINLTSILDDEEFIIKHFIDCMHIIKDIKDDDTVADIGTGAGFPGIVIAIAKPNIKITLIDALNKRTNFLQILKEELNLKNVNIKNGRAEDIANKKEYREIFSFVTSRAVAPLNVLLELLSGFTTENGRVVVMKGKNALEEVLKARKAQEKLKLKEDKQYSYDLTYNKETFTHYNIIYKKYGSLDIKYPRQYSKIRKNPL